MAFTHENLSGYLDDAYMEGPYLGGTYGVPVPAQFEVKIVNSETATQAQFEAKIVDAIKRVGAQYQALIEASKTMPAQFAAQILDRERALQAQYEALINDLTKVTGAQFGSVSADFPKAMPAQFESRIIDSLKNVGAQYQASNLAFTKPIPSSFIKTGIVHRICQGYLEGGYLESAYLAEFLCASLHSQFEVKIVDSKNTQAQFEAKIDSDKAVGSQFAIQIIDFEQATNAQYKVSIIKQTGAQYQVVLYNLTQTRILCDFLSRGLSVAQGGTGGLNWTATIGGSPITKPGDFSPNNLNTDIVEQRWESTAGSVSNVNLDVDTEISQGVTIDTLAILDHNFSPGATLVLQGSNVSNFSIINTTITIPIEEENIFYIAPTFPTATDQNRYWRFNINDPLNSDGFLRVGTIVFGNAIIMSEENCVTDKIKRTTAHFADRVRTEGFTTVSNDRAIKRKIDLRFENIKFGLGDFEKLNDIFRTARTSLKCLWIPTPQIPDRFAVFGKITQLPTEEHNVKSRTDVDLDLVTFNLTIDESF